MTNYCLTAMRVIAFTENLGDGVFIYEGVQGLDDPVVTVWRFAVYGGLAAYEDVASPEAMGSQIIVLTGPKAAFLAKGGN